MEPQGSLAAFLVVSLPRGWLEALTGTLSPPPLEGARARLEQRLLQRSNVRHFRSFRKPAESRFFLGPYQLFQTCHARQAAER